jgi:ketosteroid isomerase-like protein
MNKNLLITGLLAIFLMVSAVVKAQEDSLDIQKQVFEVENAFAKTMADRDHASFVTFLSEETVFLSETKVLRGRQAVAAEWKPYFTEPDPPFSWYPETVAVLDSGKLALSTGPVLNAAGQRVATYTSTWRQEEPGVWRIIFDRGTKYCP